METNTLGKDLSPLFFKFIVSRTHRHGDVPCVSSGNQVVSVPRASSGHGRGRCLWSDGTGELILIWASGSMVEVWGPPLHVTIHL